MNIYIHKAACGSVCLKQIINPKCLGLLETLENFEKFEQFWENDAALENTNFEIYMTLKLSKLKIESVCSQMWRNFDTRWTFWPLHRPKLVNTSLIPFETMDSGHRKLSCVCINSWCININGYKCKNNMSYSLIEYDFYRHFPCGTINSETQYTTRKNCN